MAVLDTRSGGGRRNQASPLGISGYPFSIAVWVKRIGTNGGCLATIGHNTWDSNKHVVHPVNCLSVCNSSYNQSSNVGGDISTTVWEPIVVVWASSTSRTVYRGSSSSSTTATASICFEGGNNLITGSGGEITVGRGNQYSQRWPGLISHVAYWDKALTTTEVDEYMGGGNPLAIAASNLRAYYSDTSLSGSTWSDVSGNGYHLTLEGGAVIDTTTAGPTVDAPPSSVISFTVAPTVSTRTGTSYTLTGTLSAQGQVFGVAVPHDANTPSIAQIVAGKNAAGAAAAGAGSASTTTGSPHNFVLTVSGTGIAASPSHDIHYVGREPE